MQFSAREDIEAPIGDVFDKLSEFENFERSAIRRGIDVQRCAATGRGGRNRAWDARAQIRGRPREFHIVLTRFDRPSVIRFDSTSKGVKGIVLIELLALSPRRTRMQVDVALSASTLTARLFLQSAKFARKNILRRFRQKLAQFAKEIEGRDPRQA